MALINTAKVFSVFVLVISILVMAGWFLDVPILKSILPHWVTMKFNTALCFFLSGIILYFCADAFIGKNSLVHVILPLPCLLIAMLMACLLLSVILGVNTGIENLFIKEEMGAIATTVPGRPSLGTMICFIIIDLVGLVTIINAKGDPVWYRLFGFLIAALGVLAIIGYGINMPQLYYSIEDFSSAMAFHTAILFAILGIGFFILGNLAARRELL